MRSGENPNPRKMIYGELMLSVLVLEFPWGFATFAACFLAQINGSNNEAKTELLQSSLNFP